MADFGGDSGANAPLLENLTAHGNGPGVIGINAGDCSNNFSSPRADKSSDSEDLSGVHSESDVLESAFRTEPGHFQNRCRGIDGR